MDNKLGQRRGKIQQFNENLNPVNIPARIMENYSPELQELMEILRETDNNIREIADPEGDKENTLKDLLKVAKTNFNRREYMTAVVFLGKFHDKLELIDKEIAKLQNSVDAKHYEFLFGDIEPSHIDYLSDGLGEKFNKYLKTPTGILNTASLNVEANAFTDWWHNNITSDRGKALSAWEKRFPQYVKDLKNQTGMMVSKSEALLNFLLSSLKVMNGFRNSRKLEDYIKVAKKLQEKFKNYNVAFLQFYNKYVKKLIEYQKSESALRQIMPPDEAAQEMTKPFFEDGKKSPESERMEVSPDELVPSAQVPTEPPSAVSVTPNELLPSYSRPPPLPFPTPIPPSYTKEDSPISSSPPTIERMAPIEFPESEIDLQKPFPKPPKLPKEFRNITRDTLPSPSITSEQPTLPSAGNEPKTLPGVGPKTLPGIGPPERVSRPYHGASNHFIFLQSLSSMENEHPMIIAKTIINYANSIKTSDVEISNRLLNIAKRVLKG
jgi:hypothetical protein